jgi:hypothetical protein
MRQFRGGHRVYPSGEQERQGSKPATQSASMSIAMFRLHVSVPPDSAQQRCQLVDDRQPLYAGNALSGFTIGTLADLKNRHHERTITKIGRLA